MLEDINRWVTNGLTELANIWERYRFFLQNERLVGGATETSFTLEKNKLKHQSAAVIGEAAARL